MNRRAGEAGIQVIEARAELAPGVGRGADVVGKPEVAGVTPAKDSALASAGAELRRVNDVTLLAKFDGEFASRAQTYAGTDTMRWAW
jgi:hypothetical protein